MTETKIRKIEHIDICIKNDVQARSITTGFGDIHLIHRALPKFSLKEIDTSIDFFGHKLAAPFVIEAMTGGTERAAKINESLAQSAENLTIAMGVGSQRVALEDPRLEYTFKIVRDTAPHAFLIGNLGLPQIMGKHGLVNIEKAINMINANAFAIHMNILQEVMQLEGDTFFDGLLEKIDEITSIVGIPIIAKETGAGIAAEEARLLEDVNVGGIDVGGAGGTSWAAVESYRAKMKKNTLQEQYGKVFWDWGIPTAVSAVEVSQSTRLTVIASGGIRNGIDAAKVLALGADAVGLALPLLKPALDGDLDVVLKALINELKIAMFLVGAKSVKDLKKSPLVVTGKTGDWLRYRGFQPEKYAQRRKRA